MRRRWWTGLVSTILTSAALAAPAVLDLRATHGAAPTGSRAMWLWGDYAADEVIAWAGAQHISAIFVNVSSTVRTDGSLTRLRSLRTRADAAKVRMYALIGENTWTTNHAAALAWRKAVVATGLFDGIHLDVEPYLTSGWRTDLEATEVSYLKLLAKMRAGSPLPVEADVPFWYGEYRVGGRNFADEVLKRVDAVTVMSYRDTATGPNSILDVSQDWLKRGAAAGKPVRLGAETGTLPDCDHCTFAEEGGRQMLAVLAQVDAGTRKSPVYAGVAVHRYGSWRVLKP